MSTNNQSLVTTIDGLTTYLLPGVGLVVEAHEHNREISRLQSALSALTRAHHELGEREAEMRAVLEKWQFDNFDKCVACGGEKAPGGGHYLDCDIFCALNPPTTSAEEGGT